MGVLVVGVDGSPGARAAASFALEEARLRRATLRLVAAWHVPAAVYGGGFAPPGPDLDSDLEEAATTAIEQTLASLGPPDDVEIDRRVREGQAAQVLVEEAADADLLIVGSRGLGGFRGLLLGSVSQQCAQHAHCPVVIVRPESGGSTD